MNVAGPARRVGHAAVVRAPQRRRTTHVNRQTCLPNAADAAATEAPDVVQAAPLWSARAAGGPQGPREGP